jgi:uncharacterized protein (TIGR01244 family)
LLRARDTTVVEVLEWKSQAAIDDAYANLTAQRLQAEYAAVCDNVPFGALAEASELFSGFENAKIQLVQPAFVDLFNHVQVNARLSTSGAITAPAVAQMAQEGYAGLINLLPDDNKSALEKESELAAAQGLVYHHIPVDFSAPTTADYHAFERALRSFGEEQKVYVHCAANMRASVFVAIYGTRCMDWSTERARSHIAEVWEPNPVWLAFLSAHGIRSR